MGQLTQFIAIISGAIGATVVRVIDGDTVRVRASVWFGLLVEVDVRLAGWCCATCATANTRAV
ncbi:hypothetical protein OAS67_10150 [Alphaproteobacteria bacterium]|jgi:endonuclease YncB( thermonuclease family)|nr:hypothetical protein [Alphaproteobacteria bacterium]|tara:strand:- start:541 stop:729 length:189 start_codon:yes stop_codon:yes gene_type:complete